MTRYLQGPFPFSGNVDPQTGSPLFKEEFTAGSGESWSPAPGVSPPLPGMQNASSRWRVWNPGDAPVPPWGQPMVDCNRQAGLFMQNYPGSGELAWAGVTAFSSEWSVDDPEFRATFYTRVGKLEFQRATGGYGGAIISLEDLSGATDGPFIALGWRQATDGTILANFSKWSDSATLVSEFDAQLSAGAAECELRAFVGVDPEDGIEVVAQVGGNGFGWRTFSQELLLESEATSRICIGYGATGVASESSPAVVACDYLRLFRVSGVDPDLELLNWWLNTDGGRNWPGG